MINMRQSPMKIALLSTHSCPLGDLGDRDNGGMSVFVRELAMEMGRQGHLADVYTRAHDAAEAQTIPLGENARLFHISAGDEYNIHKLALYSYLPDFACNTENFRKKNDLQYDLIFSHYWLSGFAARYLSDWWRIPHVAMFHTLGAVKNSLGIEEDETDLRIFTERETVRDCQHIIATTEREKQQLINLYEAQPERISVIPCGVNMGLFHPMDKAAARKQAGFAAADKIILFVGRIEPLKGIDQLLIAMSQLKGISNLKLVIAGGGEYSRYEMEKLRQLAVDLEIGGRVIFKGLVKHELLHVYYAAADVCVVPSYYESFSLVALESLACGTPVIANDVGNLRNIIRSGETGYVLEDNSPAAMAASLSGYFTGLATGMRAPEEIRASVANYRWAVTTERVIREMRLAMVAGIVV